MALESEGKVLAGDAATVINHANPPHAPLFQLDVNAARSGVHSVFQDFLEDGGRALHHLAGGDLVDQEIGEAADDRHGSGKAREGRSIRLPAKGFTARRTPVGIGRRKPLFSYERPRHVAAKVKPRTACRKAAPMSFRLLRKR